MLRTMLDHARQPSGFEVVDLARHHRARAGAGPAAAVALEYPAAGLDRRGSAGDQGGRDATGDGAAQPGHQRARRHAGRRHAVDRRGGAAGRGPPGSRRYGIGDSGRGHGPPVRCVGDDQTGRSGHRAGTRHRARRGSGARRLDLRRQSGDRGVCSSSTCPPPVRTGAHA